MGILSIFRRSGALTTPPPPVLKAVASPVASSKDADATDVPKALRLPNFT